MSAVRSLTILLSFALPSLVGYLNLPYSVPDAYQVYAAILPGNRAYSEAVSVLISETTVFFSPDCLDPDPRYRLTVKEAIADYRRVNRSTLALQRMFSLAKPYEVLPDSEFTGNPLQLRNSSLFRQYLLGHPNFPGFIQLSGVGFSHDKTIAIAYMLRNCGPLCSSGELVVTQKRGGSWKPLNIRGLGCFWAS